MKKPDMFKILPLVLYCVVLTAVALIVGPIPCAIFACVGMVVMIIAILFSKEEKAPVQTKKPVLSVLDEIRANAPEAVAPAMTVYAEFAHPQGGTNFDVAYAAARLRPGARYKVIAVEIQNYHTNIWLDNDNRGPFNSVQFEFYLEDGRRFDIVSGKVAA